MSLVSGLELPRKQTGFFTGQLPARNESWFLAVSGESNEVVGHGKCLIISSIKQTNTQIQHREGRESSKKRGGKEILICSISQFSWPITGYHPDIRALNLELGGDV